MRRAVFVATKIGAGEIMHLPTEIQNIEITMIEKSENKDTRKNKRNANHM
jgi:hypothetical protein